MHVEVQVRPIAIGRDQSGRLEPELGRPGVTQRPTGIGRKKRFGSSGRTRTYNPPVNSRMLYH
jgi:hypothetical protein